MVKHAATVVSSSALEGAEDRPIAPAPSPVKDLGNAQFGAPSELDITIVVNSTIFLWTWMLMLVLTMGGVVLTAGRRCFFSVMPLIVDCVVLMVKLAVDMLLSWCPSATYPHGQERPLGATSSSSRTMTCLVGRAPLGDD